MKIAAGCFGCLAFIFLILVISSSWLLAAVAQASPDAYSALGPLTGIFQYLNMGCCCLSGVAAVALFAAGSMRSRDPIE